jgi:hypothetical protein
MVVTRRLPFGRTMLFSKLNSELLNTKVAALIDDIFTTVCEVEIGNHTFAASMKRMHQGIITANGHSIRGFGFETGHTRSPLKTSFLAWHFPDFQLPPTHGTHPN